ncbi:aminopeptidase N-like [Xylocopa sonorina]|uniref:aminopeptidase N-like n=1 Tax=Xylocopa sonorina TaxID=1818115 RepID=UPI00403AC212
MKCLMRLYVLVCAIATFELVAPFGVCPDTLTCDENRTRSDVEQLCYRLPSQVIPTKYTINIKKDKHLFSYDGRMTVHLDILEPRNTIILHNDGLHISEQSVILERAVVADGKRYFTSEPLSCYLYDTQRQFYYIKSVKTLEPNKYKLTLSFIGKIRDDVFGFYRSHYVENNETKWMAVTQFSPTYARRAFPCMDEPRFKAIFQFNFQVDGHVVTSNTRPTYITPGREYRFKETPRMPTYLVGWAMHEFVSEALKNVSGDFRMWTRRSMDHRGSFALNQGRSIYSFLNDWLGIANPIRKMDQFAVPDFNFHAMENWGMITYRESVVLHDAALTPTKYMLDGLTTMAHEYAHTWFGNLVTPTFWDVAWLKEGFASYFQHFAVAMVQPSWRMMDKFVVETLQPAMLLDSADHDRAMNGRSDGSPASTMAMLDFVSYKKGASVIRMISHVIGESAFQEGLRNYLRHMAYRAATPTDLYEHLQNSTEKLGQSQSNVSIKNVMESWANQPGYPLLTVTRNYETQEIALSQERFCWNKDRRFFEWWIPVNFVAEKQANFSKTAPNYWLQPGNDSLSIKGVASDEWVLFNVQHTGYYRVNYDEKNWQMVTRYLNSKHFHKVHRANRAALIDDAFNLARGGYVDYSIPFNLSKYLIQEREYEPWVAAVNNFRFLNKMLSSVPNVQQAFQDYAVRLLRNMYEHLNFTESEHEDFTTKLHRELILSTSCLLRNADCLSISEALFLNWIKNPQNAIPPNVKSFVYCEAIRNGREEYWTMVRKRWLNTDLQTEQELLLQALGCTRKSAFIKQHLQLSITNEKNVRKQQRMTIVNAVLTGKTENVNHVLKFVETSLHEIIKLRGYDFLGKMITSIGNAMTTEEQMEMLQSFVERNSEQLGSVLSTAKKALSVATENVEWVKRYAPNIANCFQ